MNHENNINRIRAVSEAFGELKDSVVFVGGSTVSLYADQVLIDEVRETDDVDVIVEVLSFSDHTKFQEKIRAKGFNPDVSSKVKERYRVNNIKVDIIPTIDIAMAFHNKWYPEGFNNAIEFTIDESTTVKILSAPYFLATKLEAFKDRGLKDPRQSQDFEDIVFVLENRQSIWKELAKTDGALRDYLQEEFKKLLANSSIYEWIDCHVDYFSPPPTDQIIENLKGFAKS